MNYITMPAVGLILLTVAMQLYTIAESSSDKVVQYAEDINMAMDCALLGIPISQCSPKLLETDFTSEINQTLEILHNVTKSG